MKTAYIIDSASFLSEKEAQEMDLFFLPLHISIEDKGFKEGVDLDIDYLYQALADHKNCSTSQPSPGEITDLILKIKELGYNRAVFSGIASGLSKTQENMLALANTEDFEMHIIDAKSVGFAQLNSLLNVRYQVEEQGIEIEQAIENVQADILASKTVLIVDDLNHLSKSGRMSSSAAIIGGILQIKPILQLDNNEGGKMLIADKVRTAKKAYKKMIDILFEGIDSLEDYVVLLAQFKAPEANEFVLEELNKRYPNQPIIQKTLVPTVGVHTGLNTIGMQIAKK